MDDRWDLETSEEWEGTVERGHSRLSGAARLAMGLLLVVGIGIGFAAARISGDGGSSAAGSGDDASATQTGTQSELAEEGQEPTTARGVTPTTVSNGGGRLVATAGEVIVGAPLNILSGTNIGETWPIGIVDSDKGYILYGSDAHSFSPGDPKGVEAWTSPDGQTWTSVGIVIGAPATMHNVVATDQGFLAPGSVGSGRPVLFRSDDGISWTTHDLPSDGERLPVGVAANESVIVVWAGFGGPEQNSIVEALPEQVRPDENNGLGLSMGGPPFAVQVQAPMNITIFSATAEELGLDDEDVDIWMGGGTSEGSTIWHSTNGTDWTISEIDEVMVQSISVNSSGEFIATGYGFSGEQSLRSSDGLTWETASSVRNTQQVVSGDSGSIGISYGNRAKLAISTDDETWMSIDPRELLNDELEWNYHPVVSEGSGFAVAAMGYDNDAMMFEPAPVEIEKDGVLLESNMMRGSLRITRDGEEVFRLSLHTGRVSDDIEVDIDGQSLTFLDDRRAPIVSFTFEELREAEQQTYAAMTPGNSESALLYSPDGTTWSVAHLPNADFANSVSLLKLSDHQLLAVSTKHEQRFSDVQPAPSVSVLTVALP